MTWRLVRRVALAVILAAVVGTAALWAITPSGDQMQTRVDALVRQEHAVLIQPGEVPPLLAEAVVSVEDERFYQHHGIDIIGLGRAALFDVTHRCLCQGGSTITEQLVKDVYLGGNDRGPQKLADMMLAVKVEFVYNKQQILADYLSEVPVGGGRHGMVAAACTYFHEPLAQLTLGEDALLAGLPQAPNAYDPRHDPEEAAARRRVVLEAMAEGGYITPQQVAAAEASPVLLVASTRTAACGIGSPAGISSAPSSTTLSGAREASATRP